MTDEPELIWARYSEGVDPYTGTRGLLVDYKQFANAAKYVRADLAPQWQPIESAPRETMHDILVSSCEGVQIAWWCERDNSWLTPEGKDTWAEPTHWTPLPTPPGGKDD